MARFKGLELGVAENSQKVGNSQCVAMETRNADFRIQFDQEGMK